MAFDKAEWRKKYYAKNKARYLEWSRASQERKKAKRGPVKIGRPASLVPADERKRRKREKDKERLKRLAERHAGHIYIGSVCKRGHSPERYVASGQCVACVADRQRARLSANPENHRNLVKKWQVNNRERLRQLARDRYAKDPEKHRQKVLAQAKKNPGRANASVARRNAAKDQRTPAWADLTAIKEFYKFVAGLKNQTGVKYVVDHVIPLRGELVSGLHVLENLQVLENVANIKKKNHFVIE